MGDIDVIAQRIMQGVSQSLTDLNKVVAAKNAAEEGERKRIAWEREEERRNKEINWRVSPLYLNMPKDMQKRVDDYLTQNGYSKDGKVITQGEMDNALKAMGQDKQFMTYHYDASLREINNEIAATWEAYQKEPNKDKKAEIMSKLEGLQAREAAVRGVSAEHFKAFQAREHQQKELSQQLEIAKLRYGQEKSAASRDQKAREAQGISWYTQKEAELMGKYQAEITNAKGDPKKLKAAEANFRKEKGNLLVMAQRFGVPDPSKLAQFTQPDFSAPIPDPGVNPTGVFGGFGLGPTKAAPTGTAYDVTGGIEANPPSLNLGPSNAAAANEAYSND